MRPGAHTMPAGSPTIGSGKTAYATVATSQVSRAVSCEAVRSAGVTPVRQASPRPAASRALCQATTREAVPSYAWNEQAAAPWRDPRAVQGSPMPQRSQGGLCHVTPPPRNSPATHRAAMYASAGALPGVVASYATSDHAVHSARHAGGAPWGGARGERQPTQPLSARPTAEVLPLETGRRPQGILQDANSVELDAKIDAKIDAKLDERQRIANQDQKENNKVKDYQGTKRVGDSPRRDREACRERDANRDYIAQLESEKKTLDGINLHLKEDIGKERTAKEEAIGKFKRSKQMADGLQTEIDHLQKQFKNGRAELERVKSERDTNQECVQAISEKKRDVEKRYDALAEENARLAAKVKELEELSNTEVTRRKHLQLQLDDQTQQQKQATSKVEMQAKKDVASERALAAQAQREASDLQEKLREREAQLRASEARNTSETQGFRQAREQERAEAARELAAAEARWAAKEKELQEELRMQAIVQDGLKQETYRAQVQLKDLEEKRSLSLDREVKRLNQVVHDQKALLWKSESVHRQLVENQSFCSPGEAQKILKCREDSNARAVSRLNIELMQKDSDIEDLQRHVAELEAALQHRR